MNFSKLSLAVMMLLNSSSGHKIEQKAAVFEGEGGVAPA